MGVLFELQKNELHVLSPQIPADLLSRAEAEDNVSAYGIEEAGQTIGCALVSGTGLRVELLWYYVAEPFRGDEIGSECFFDLMNELRAKGADELVAPVYADTDRSLVRMLYGFGPSFEALPGCQAFFPAEELNSVPELLKEATSSVPLRACSDDERKALQKRLEDEGKDLYDVTADGYNTSVSAVYKKDGEALGALLFKRKSRNEICLSFAGSVAKDPVVMMDMLRLSASALRGLPSGVMISMSIIDPKMKELMLSLLKDVKGLKVVDGELAVISLSRLDRIREDEEAMLEVSKELGIQ